eukprot:scaffold2033_cov367-Prasinococcus_capsulatus_cf.AAC.28
MRSLPAVLGDALRGPEQVRAAPAKPREWRTAAVRARLARGRLRGRAGLRAHGGAGPWHPVQPC